jgi:hypothetical protein
MLYYCVVLCAQGWKFIEYKKLKTQKKFQTSNLWIWKVYGNLQIVFGRKTVPELAAELAKFAGELEARKTALEAQHADDVKRHEQKNAERKKRLELFKHTFPDYGAWNFFDLFVLCLGFAGYIFIVDGPITFVWGAFGVSAVLLTLSLWRSNSSHATGEKRLRWFAGWGLVLLGAISFAIFKDSVHPSIQPMFRDIYVFFLSLFVLTGTAVLSWCNFTTQPFLWRRHLAVLTLDARG